MEEKEIAEEGEKIYAKLLPQLLPHYKGEYLTIHVPSGEYWITSSLVESLKKASEKYDDGLFYSVRIGEKSVAGFR